MWRQQGYRSPNASLGYSEDEADVHGGRGRGREEGGVGGSEDFQRFGRSYATQGICIAFDCMQVCVRVRFCVSIAPRDSTRVSFSLHAYLTVLALGLQHSM